MGVFNQLGVIYLWIYLVASLIGLGAGILGSMFDLGGGFLIVPFLNIAGVNIRIAVGTSARLYYSTCFPRL